MLPKKPKHLLYGVLLMCISIIGTSAIANTKIHTLITELTSAVDITEDNETTVPKVVEKSSDFVKREESKALSMPMFTTIIIGADEEVTCINGGNTVARFNLCGDFDDRLITTNLTGTYQWQQFNPSGSCTFDVNDDCSNTDNSCWSDVSTNSTFTLDASVVSSSNGAEYRVRVDSGTYYYFKVKKSTITQTYVKRDYICGVDGRIQITNLSSAYEYSIDNGTGFGAWQPSAIFDGLAPGTYIVKARLQNTLNTCEYPYEPITIEQQDIDIDVTFTDAQCFGQNGSITVNVQNVPGPYKYTLLDDTGVPQEFTTFIPDNPYTFAAVGFGTYSVQVETQQCTGDPANGISAPRQDSDTAGNPIVIGDGLVALSASTEVNNSFGCSVASVDIIVRTSGGMAPYTFTVSDGGSSSTSYTDELIYTVTSPGTYNFSIEDVNGCPISASADVEELIPPVITASGTDGTCSNGGAKIDFNVSNARGYNLSYRADPSDPWSTNPQLSVAAGTYNNLQVRYQQGGFDCTLDLPGSVTVSTVGVINPGAPLIVTNRSCNATGGLDGGIIEFPGPFSGGSGSGYVFSISGDDASNFSTQTVYNNLAPGTYTPIIRDGGGCRLELTPVTILDVDPPTAIAFTQNNINCAAGTSDVQLVATSNAAIATYEVVNPAATVDGDGDNTNNVITSLSTGTAYLFRITDVNGCRYEDSFTPVNTSSVRVRVKSGGDTRVCFGEADGTGTFVIDGFLNNYTYNINGGTESAPQNADEVDLPPSGDGTYTITVTDADTGCMDTASITIQEATNLTLGGTVTAMSCANNNLGSVRANPVGGWGNYRYMLLYPDGTTSIGPQSGRTFGNLNQTSTPGNPYTLTVVDSEGCTNTFTFDLSPVNAPTITLDAVASDLCYVPGTGATLEVSSTAGTAALATHQYRINGGILQSSSTFSNLSPGTYTIEVVDGNNCRDNINVTVRPRLRVRTSITTEIPCGGADGRIRVRATGGYLSGSGTKQYQLSIDGAAFSASVPLTSNTFNYDTNIPGTYIFRVTDNEGCVADSDPLVIEPPVNIAPATHQVFPPVCGETNSGRAIITPDATSGVPPYEIDFGNTGTFTSQTLYSNLNQGQSYDYVVRDSRGCETVVQQLTIPNAGTAPDATVTAVDAVCNAGTVAGSVQVTAVAGGTADFIYILEDQFGVEIDRIGPTSSTSEIFTNVPVGDYRVVTLDQNGCRDEDTVTINDADIDVVPDTLPVPVCGPGGFSNTVTITGGVGPFDIRLVTNPAGAFVGVNSPPNRHTFSGLQFGVSYTVEVRDNGTGCTHIETIDPITVAPSLTVLASSTPNYCDTSRNGQIEYTISGFNSGDDLLIELINVDDGTLITLENPPNVTTIPYTNTYETLPGNYQVIVTNQTDNCNDGGALITIGQNLPAIYVIAEEPANCNADGQFTVVGAGGSGSPYEFAFGPQGFTPVYDGSATDDYSTNTTFTGAAGNYDIYVRDALGCISFDIATIIQQQAAPVLNIPVVDNQCDVTATNFQIVVSTPSTTDTPQFTISGVTQPGVLNGAGTLYEATFNVSTPGDYDVLLEDADGCSSTGTAQVFEFLSASGDFSTIPSCNNTDGVITINTNGGSGNFSFQLRDGAGIPTTNVTGLTNGIFTGVGPGDYQVMITDDVANNGTIFCPFLVDNINLIAATEPVIDLEDSDDISCNGANDGSVRVQLQAGTDIDTPIEFILTNLDTASEVTRNATGVFSNLPEADYQVEVRTARGCSDITGTLPVNEPQSFAITASAPPFSCTTGANRFSSTIITVTVPTATPGTIGSGYQYSITGFENYQANNTFEIIDNGAPQDITVYAIDGNGCRSFFDLPTINQPTDVVPVFSVESVLNCRDAEVVRVQIPASQTTDFTVRTISITPVADFTNTTLGNDYVDIPLPAAGDYLFEVTDNVGGCTYPIPRHQVIAPINPIATISEAKPIECFGVDDGELFIEVTNYVGTYDYEVFAVDNSGVETSTGFTGSFDTTNFSDINSDPARITGLPGGNFVVRINSTDVPYCTDSSNLATIRTPSGPLDVSAIEIGNVSCTDNTGKIEAIGSGGWETTPTSYQYRLLLDDGTGVYNEQVAFSTNREFENLSNGNYRVEIRDIEGCTDGFDITLDAITPISAGIREPSGLVCPAGNNAILEAYDPTTGDATSATAGATGGVAGSGYNYQLIYLGSNDITDEVSRSGLQSTPTFEGTTGGFISAGWYAIEISSSFNCVGVTVPYFVDPPPAIIPNLVQVRAPGCGGLGEMRLSIENPELGFVYEYRPIGVPDTDPFTSMGAATSVLIPGSPGFYQYDVRKVSTTNICDAVVSNGLTLIDAQIVDLVVNLPDDISCFSEIDGRIESFASGGVGNYRFTLYDGDPGADPFNPNASATIVQGPQDDGTFEGIDAGSNYYLTVTSGISCGEVEGPYEIIRPEPILFTATPGHISCNGEEDGSITIEVLSGGEGLIQFAISPNFTEFFSDPDNPNQYVFTDLDNGSYEILIQDASGCDEKQTIEIEEPDELVLGADETPELCLDASDGTITLTVTGGTPFEDTTIPSAPVSYFETRISGAGFVEPDPADPTGGFIRNDDLFFDNLQGDETYVIFVRDANGCTDDEIVTIGMGVELSAEAIPVYGCDGIFPNSTVTVEMEDASVLPDVLFYLEDVNSTEPPLTHAERLALAETQRTWGDLPPSDYNVHIYHENGCRETIAFTINEYTPLMLDVVKTGPNEMTATASGGFGGYEYFFQGNSTGSENIFTLNEDAVVTIRVEDQMGCHITITMPFNFTGMLDFPEYFTPNGDVLNEEWAPRNREFFPNVEVKIYDRYGRVVAVLDEVFGWDGTYEGNEVPTGDYWYVVNQNDSENIQYVGHFTLYR